MRTLLLVVVLFAAGYGVVTISIQTGAYAVGNAVLATVSQKVRMIGRQASDLFYTPEKPVYRKRQAPAEKRETPVEKRKRPVEERQATVSDHPETASRAPDRQAPVEKREQPPEERNAPVEEQAVTFSDYLETANRAFVAMDRSCSEADRTRLGRAYYRLVAYAHDLSSRKPANPAGSAADNGVPNLSDFDIFEQVIDATRRGVLRSRHFKPDAGVSAKRPTTQHKSGQRPLRTVRSETTGPKPQAAVASSRIRLTRCPPAAP